MATGYENETGVEAAEAVTASEVVGAAEAQGTNTPPVVDGTLSFSTPENTAIVISQAELLSNVSDVDSASLVGATLTITDYVAGEDELSFTDQSGISGSFDAATGTLTLTGTASVAAYQAALRTVGYRNTSENPLAGVRNVEIVVDDGAGTNNLSVPLIAEVTVVPVNDAPVASQTAGSLYEIQIGTPEPFTLLPARAIRRSQPSRRVKASAISSRWMAQPGFPASTMFSPPPNRPATTW